MKLTPEQQDRARGALACAGVADALGVPYEARPPLPDGIQPVMKGGGLGNYLPGEWSDDTQMLTVIGTVASKDPNLSGLRARDAIARGFLYWSRGGATDMGHQTAAVLGRARKALASGRDVSTGMALTMASMSLHEATGKTAGNGSLMRTAPVALAYLSDPVGCALAARKVSELTHYDPLAGDACAIWCELIRRAIMGEIVSPAVVAGLVIEGEEDRAQWLTWLDEAMVGEPRDFRNNGYVVAALQAALSALMPMLEQLWKGEDIGRKTVRKVLNRAVRCGWDTDTVAAIAGMLAGAIAGLEAIPPEWRKRANGWCYAPNNRRQAGKAQHIYMGADGLALMADRIVKAS